MTVTIKDLRVKISREQIQKYRGQKGVDRIWKPYDINQNIWDLRLQTSDKSSVPVERKFKEDVEKQVYDFKEISSRMRDSPLYVKSFDKRKSAFYFQHDEDSHTLDSIDEVRSHAQKMQGGNIQWADIS